MPEEINTPPWWWHNRGRWTYDTADHRDKVCATITSKSCHVKIRRLRENKWLVAKYMWGKDGGEDRGERIFTDVELMTAFDTERDRHATDAEFAKRFMAEYAAPGKFIRTGDYLNLFCPGSGVDGDPNMSVKLNKYLRMKILRFLTTGIANP